MFKQKSGAPNVSEVAPTQRGHFPTFRRIPTQLRALPHRFWPFLRRVLLWLFRITTRFVAWFKRNFRRLATACLVLAAIWTATNIYATILRNRELEKVRDRGEPTRWEEVAPVPIADSENAATLYDRAAEKLQFSGTENYIVLSGKTPSGERVSNARIEELKERVFRINRVATQLIFQASRMPLCRLRKNWINPILDPQSVKSWASMREFARFMGAQAEYEAQHGHVEQAFRCIAVIYRISEHVAQDPTLISALVGIAIENTAATSLARVLDITPITLAQARVFVAQLPRSDWDALLRRAWFNERAMMLPLFNDSKMWKPYFAGSEDMSARSLATDLTGAYGGYSSLLSNRFLFALLLPVSRMDEVAALRSKPFKNQSVPWYAFITQNSSVQSDKVYPAGQRATDNREMTRIALALKLWKNARGSYPKSMNELKLTQVSLLKDALACKTIGYKTKNGEFLLYGFGLNRYDDKGVSYGFDPMHPDASNNVQGDDITWNQSIGTIKPPYASPRSYILPH